MGVRSTALFAIPRCAGFWRFAFSFALHCKTCYDSLNCSARKCWYVAGTHCLGFADHTAAPHTATVQRVLPRGLGGRYLFLAEGRCPEDLPLHRHAAGRRVRIDEPEQRRSGPEQLPVVLLLEMLPLLTWMPLILVSVWIWCLSDVEDAVLLLTVLPNTSNNIIADGKDKKRMDQGTLTADYP